MLAHIFKVIMITTATVNVLKIGTHNIITISVLKM